MSQRKKKETYLSQLPGGLHLGRVIAHARLHGGVDQVWGETHLLVHDDQLIVMTRKSVMDTYEVLNFDRASQPRIEEVDFRAKLVLADAEGAEVTIPIKKDERMHVERVLHALRTGAADGSWPPTSKASRSAEEDESEPGFFARLFGRKRSE